LTTFGIILTGGPYQTQRWDTACRIADAALSRSDKVTFFLFLDGIYNALGTQVFPVLQKLPMEFFKDLQAKGAEIFACEVCSYNRGLDEGKDYLKGIKIVSVAFVAGMASMCDRMITL
jgi:tRNA 2-thiouridine synthesizing protein D